MLTKRILSTSAFGQSYEYFLLFSQHSCPIHMCVYLILIWVFCRPNLHWKCVQDHLSYLSRPNRQETFSQPECKWPAGQLLSSGHSTGFVYSTPSPNHAFPRAQGTWLLFSLRVCLTFWKGSLWPRTRTHNRNVGGVP